MNEYLQFSTSFLQQHMSKETYPVHIELQSKDMKGDVYITGNQEALANWNPKGIKMEQVNDSTCTIDLQLHLPVYFKFTRGDWEHGANIFNAEPGNLIIHDAKHTNHVYRLWDKIPGRERNKVAFRDHDGQRMRTKTRKRYEKTDFIFNDVPHGDSLGSTRHQRTGD